MADYNTGAKTSQSNYDPHLAKKVYNIAKEKGDFYESKFNQQQIAVKELELYHLKGGKEDKKFGDYEPPQKEIKSIDEVEELLLTHGNMTRLGFDPSDKKSRQYALEHLEKEYGINLADYKMKIANNESVLMNDIFSDMNKTVDNNRAKGLQDAYLTTFDDYSGTKSLAIEDLKSKGLVPEHLIDKIDNYSNISGQDLLGIIALKDDKQRTAITWDNILSKNSPKTKESTKKDGGKK